MKTFVVTNPHDVFYFEVFSAATRYKVEEYLRVWEYPENYVIHETTVTNLK